MDCVIAYRIKGSKVIFVMEANGEEVCEFKNFDAAVEYADSNMLFQSGQADYQIIELDEI